MSGERVMARPNKEEREAMEIRVKNAVREIWAQRRKKNRAEDKSK